MFEDKFKEFLQGKGCEMESLDYEDFMEFKDTLDGED